MNKQYREYAYLEKIAKFVSNVVMMSGMHENRDTVIRLSDGACHSHQAIVCWRTSRREQWEVLCFIRFEFVDRTNDISYNCT